MIGELYYLLLNYLLIGVGLLLQENFVDVFIVGFECGFNTFVILLQFFEVCVLYVLGIFFCEQVSEFFFGLLIGVEVVSMRDYVVY